MGARITFRRSTEAPRLEMVPLIDVIFLVLTFFIYAMVLMVPAKILPMRLHALQAGVQGQPAPAVTISITEDGSLAVDREPVTLASLLPTVEAIVRERPETVVYIAPAAQGSTDRLPMFVEVYERLSHAGLDIRLVGRHGEGSADGE